MADEDKVRVINHISRNCSSGYCLIRNLLDKRKMADYSCCEGCDGTRECVNKKRLSDCDITAFTILQAAGIDMLKWEESQRYGRDVGREAAYHWMEKCALPFRQAWEHGIRHPDDVRKLCIDPAV